MKSLFPDATPVKNFYNLTEAAKILAISRSTLYRMVSRGFLRAVKIGSITKISREILCEYLSENEVDPDRY